MNKEGIYVVTYLSDSGIHYPYRCFAQNKKDARRQCHIYMGVPCKKMVEVRYEGRTTI